MTKSIRVAFFIRSATGDINDLKRQLKELTKELPARGFNPETCKVEVYKDEHQSGLRHGLEFQRLIQDVEHGKVDVIMIQRMNRISRKLKNLMAFPDFVQSHSIRFISTHENVDSIYWPKPQSET
jgi:DNA invertase Pin-like site-specific DNA recombinase